MPTLKGAYEAPNVTKSHKDFVWGKVDALTKDKKGTKRELLDLLRVVYTHYDNGGHSCGRSKRSRLLESCMETLRGKKFHARDWRKLRSLITILVSMYHDDEYIKKMQWYDGHTDDEFGLISNIQERAHLMAVFVLVRLTELTSERPQ
jgi:hypothetical protein